MRSIHKLIMLSVGLIAWIILMFFGPTYEARNSIFLFGGLFIFAFVIIFWLLSEISAKGVPGTSFPGFRTTINPTESFATVSLPGVKEDDALANLQCFALGGNPYLVLKGGGPDNGYLVCPDDLVEKWKGDPSQFLFNVDLRPYRLVPRKGELPLSALPKEVKYAIMRHGKFTKNCVVNYGIYRHQDRMEKMTRRRDLEAQNAELNKQIEALEALVKNYRHHITTGKDKDLYGKIREKKGYMDGVVLDDSR